MDEQLPNIVSIWDPAEQAASVSSRLPANPLRKKGRSPDKETYLQDAEGVYHAIGGFQRFCHVANEDPKWFFNRYYQPGILLPNEKQEVDLSIHIHPALQRTALDGEFTDVTELDQGRDQASGGAASGARGAGGGEDPGQENGEGRALTFSEDPAAGRARSHVETHEPRLIEAMRSR